MFEDIGNFILCFFPLSTFQGHCWTGEVQQHHISLLQRCQGNSVSVWYHKAGDLWRPSKMDEDDRQGKQMIQYSFLIRWNIKQYICHISGAHVYITFKPITLPTQPHLPWLFILLIYLINFGSSYIRFWYFEGVTLQKHFSLISRPLLDF